MEFGHDMKMILIPKVEMKTTFNKVWMNVEILGIVCGLEIFKAVKMINFDIANELKGKVVSLVTWMLTRIIITKS
jgi:hypothetical protein